MNKKIINKIADDYMNEPSKCCHRGNENQFDCAEIVENESVIFCKKHNKK